MRQNITKHLIKACFCLPGFVWKGLGLYRMFNDSLYRLITARKGYTVDLLQKINEMQFGGNSKNRWAQAFRGGLIHLWIMDRVCFEAFCTDAMTVEEDIRDNLVYNKCMESCLFGLMEMGTEYIVDIWKTALVPAVTCTEQHVEWFLPGAIRLMADSPQGVEHLREVVEDELKRENDPEKTAAYYHFLFLADQMQASDYEAYIKTLRSMDFSKNNAKFYYGVHESAWMTFLNPACLYDNAYLDRRVLLKEIAEELFDSSPYANRLPHREKGKVAILVIGLHSKIHASARLVVGVANDLARRGKDVTIFASDTNSLGQDEAFCATPLATRQNTSQVFEQQHKEMVHPNICLRYVKGDGCQEHFRNTIEEVIDYSPEFIVDITWENSVFNLVFMQWYPVVKVPLGGISTCSEFHRYLVRDLEQLKTENEIYRTVEDLGQVVEANLYLPYIMDCKPLQRAKYGFGEDDFIFITVGNRLSHELSVPFLCGMADLLAQNPQLKWILVGANLPKSRQMKNLLESGQVCDWGFERNLARLFRMCDAYINPPRVGGGGSIAMAIQVGLPAVISDITSDILPFVGAENCVHGGIEELLEFSAKLSRDPNLCRITAENMRSNLLDTQFSCGNFVDILLDAVVEVFA